MSVVFMAGLLRWVETRPQCAPAWRGRQAALWGVSRSIHKGVDMLRRMSALQVIHADDSLLVLDKPEGLLSVPGRGAAGQDNLSAWVQANFADARVVHRLDQATSGLMLFARGAVMQRALSMAFEARQVHKQYVAVVEGCVEGDAGSIDAPLSADWPNRPRQVVDAAAGKPALTHWHVLLRHADSTRLLLEPVTGRSHQLRVHLQSLGHPIRGDTLYAAPPLRSTRLLLHASQLRLQHPLSGEPCSFDSPPPF